MNRRLFLKSTSIEIGAVGAAAELSKPAAAQAVEDAPTFRRPKVILVDSTAQMFRYVKEMKSAGR